MVETLTLTRLGISGPLTRTLASTNPIWVFDLTGQRRFAVAAGRQAMTLNPIAAPWALALIRSVGPAAQRCGPDLPGLKRACTTQPRSAGQSGPHPTISAALLDGEARWSALMFRLWQESTRTRTRERLRCSITPAPCWRASRLRLRLRASRVCLGVLARTGARIQRIGIEGSGSLGRPVTVALAAAGYDVREVQANRTNERRRRRRRAKTDITDAQAIAAETLTDPGLPPAGKHTDPPQAWATLVALRSWRKSLILQRVRHLTELKPILNLLGRSRSATSCPPPVA